MIPTGEQIDAYRDEGACVVRDAFAPAWLARLEAGLSAAIARPGPHAELYGLEGRPRFFGDLNAWERVDEIRDFMLRSPAAELAGRLMESRTATFLYDQVLVKAAGAQAKTPWHQDQPYWAVTGRQVCSIWAPLDPVPRSVCLQIVAGSHRWGVAYNPQRFADGRPYEGTGLPPLPDIDAERDRHCILAWELKPGDAIVFNAMAVHGAPANPTTTSRRVLSTRWLGDDARFVRPEGEFAIPTSVEGLVEGEPFSGPAYPRVWPRPETGGELLADLPLAAAGA